MNRYSSWKVGLMYWYWVPGAKFSSLRPFMYSIDCMSVKVSIKWRSVLGRVSGIPEAWLIRWAGVILVKGAFFFGK